MLSCIDYDSDYPMKLTMKLRSCKNNIFSFVLKNDDDVMLLFSCHIIQTILDHERQPIVYLSQALIMLIAGDYSDLYIKYRVHN